MSQLFKLGGWGMYPTAFIGALLVACAVQYARDPRAQRAQIVRYMSLLTMLVASLGFVSGVVKSLTSLPTGSEYVAGQFAAIGVGESLVNIGLGLFMLVVAWGAMSVGAQRASTTHSTLTEPRTH
jgi:hypothetical protein